MELREKVCTRLQMLRKESGMTQEQLAAKAGLSVDGIRKIETQRTTPALETLTKIGQALGMTLSEILDIDDPMHPDEVKRELERLRLYLVKRDPQEIRLVWKVAEAVIEGLEATEDD